MEARPARDSTETVLHGSVLPGRTERPPRSGRHEGPDAGLRERLAAVGGASAADRRHHRAQVVDGVLVELAFTAGLTTAGVALAAVGGYGRGELSPHSDLDLVLLHSTETPESYAALLAERLWYPIWDSGIKLDHSVRSVGIARQVARADLPALLGMLDLRHIAGDPALTSELSRRVLADWRADAPERLPSLLASARVRAERSGELAYAAVPDLKESRGGLRDLAVMKAVAASWVADCPHQGLTEARSELLDIRDALHLLVGRAVDRIQVQDQDPLAATLHLPDRDQLMRRVSSIGRVVGHASDLTWYRVGRALSGAPPTVVGGSGPRVQRRPLADGIVEQEGEAVLARSVDPAADPALALRLGAAAALAGIPVSPAALARVVKHAPPMPVPWPEHARRAMIALLGAGEPLAGVWEALDQAGVISAILPDWDRLRSLPQRDPVHRHTVDRHLVQTAIEAAALVRRVDRPDLLLLAALLHDIGKGTGTDHSLAGAALAPEWLAHMGVPAADAAVVIGLVRSHLLLAETAVRRDPDDPATVDAVAGSVRSPSILDLLAVLTEADAKAAGPAAWTPWKAGQVRILVNRVQAQLAASGPTTLAAEIEIEYHDGSVGLDAPGPDASGEDAVVVRITPLEDGLGVSAAAPDRRGLLAAAAGVFALHRLTVRSASVATADGRALQEWMVEPQFGDGPDPVVLRGDLTRALAGTWDIAAAVAKRRGSGARIRAVPPAAAVAAPAVLVVPGASRRSTVLEVRARDIPALLYTVASAVSTVGADVVAARVDTFGADAVDVFYLRQGRRPLDQSEREAVVAAVTRSLTPAIAS
jgi:[protein-PII] uridylyltransferase